MRSTMKIFLITIIGIFGAIHSVPIKSENGAENENSGLAIDKNANEIFHNQLDALKTNVTVGAVDFNVTKKEIDAEKTFERIGQDPNEQMKNDSKIISDSDNFESTENPPKHLDAEPGIDYNEVDELFESHRKICRNKDFMFESCRGICREIDQEFERHRKVCREKDEGFERDREVCRNKEFKRVKKDCRERNKEVKRGREDYREDDKYEKDGVGGVKAIVEDKEPDKKEEIDERIGRDAEKKMMELNGIGQSENQEIFIFNDSMK